MTNAELIRMVKAAELYVDYVAPRCYASIEAEKAIRDAADLIEAQAKRIAELEAQPPTWISVEDRLPEKMKNILAANNRGKQWDIDKAWYNGAYFDRCGKRPLCHVTHWMPLPEPPKGE